MHTPPRTNPRHAFTLVELLVVIAIIATLAGILLPVLGTMREKANSTADISKLRQIGAAVGLYIGEHNGKLPVNTDAINGTSTTDGGANRWTFQEAVGRYFPQKVGFNSTSIYNYLGDPNWNAKGAQPYPGWTAQTSYGQLAPVAFSYNPNIPNGSNWLGYMSRIPNPAQIVIVGEVNDLSLDPSKPATFAKDVQTAYRVSQPGKSAHYLFADLHVETLKGDRGYAYYTAHPNEANIWKWW